MAVCKFYLIFFAFLSYIAGAVDVESLCSDVGEHQALVQFKWDDGQLYQGRWNTFGLIFNANASVEEVLERNLLNGCDEEQFFVSDFELYEVLTSLDYGLIPCLERGLVRYEGLSDQPLGLKQALNMFPPGEHKMWQAFFPGMLCRRELDWREVRIIVAGGGYSCKPTCEEVPRSLLRTYLLSAVGEYPGELPLDVARYRARLGENSLRLLQLREEKTEFFQEKLRLAAEESVREMDQAAKDQAAGEGDAWNVVVKIVTRDGEKVGVVWDGRTVFGNRDLSLREFLSCCVLRGTSLAYTDETSKRFFAFVSDDIKQMLIGGLSADVEYGIRVKDCETEDPLEKRHILQMGDMAWTVVPGRGEGCFVYEESCTIAFSGLMLQGVPLIAQSGLLVGRVARRSLLWGYDVEHLKLLNTQGEKETSREYEDRLRLSRLAWF